MEATLAALQKLYASNSKNKIVVYAAGGGSQSIGWLLGVSGASSTILEARVPYATSSFNEILDGPHAPTGMHVTDVHGFCSLEASQALARRACLRALELERMATSRHSTACAAASGDSVLVGVGLTGALATGKEKKGAHRAYITTVDSQCRSSSYEVLLQKDLRSRYEEDGVTSLVMVKAILEACNWEVGAKEPPVANQVEVEQLGVELRRLGTSSGEVKDQDGPKTISWAVSSLYRDVGAAEFVNVVPKSVLLGNGSAASTVERCSFEDWHPFESAVVMSGSFNPFHFGHEKLAMKARDQVVRMLSEDNSGGVSEQIPIVFELAVENADKGLLGPAVAQERTDQFTNPSIAPNGPWTVALTRSPRFLEKARLFPNCYFVVGVDTGIRLINPKYYGDSQENMEAAMQAILNLGCTIIVAGRAVEGEFHTYDSLMKDKVPVHLSKLFVGLSEDEFREDISSTEIRAKRAQHE